MLTVLSAGRTIVSNPYEEIRPGFARAVDGAPAAAWWMPRRAPVLEAHFAALGLRFAFRRVSPLGGVYDGFALVGPAGPRGGAARPGHRQRRRRAAPAA